VKFKYTLPRALILMLLFATFFNTKPLHADNSSVRHKAYVYTELQFAPVFQDVPWEDMNPNLKKIPGLLSKTWLSGTDNSPGGFYVFDTIEHAQNFVRDVFPKEAASFGVAQTTRIFDAEQTEKASRDMGSVYYFGPNGQEPGAFVYTEVQINALPFDQKVNWLERNPVLKTQPGLLSKTWLSGQNTGTVGGFYAFDSLENAKKFAIEVFPESIKDLNAAFYTRVFDANITRNASIDMGSLYYKH